MAAVEEMDFTANVTLWKEGKVFKIRREVSKEKTKDLVKVNRHYSTFPGHVVTNEVLTHNDGTSTQITEYGALGCLNKYIYSVKVKDQQRFSKALVEQIIYTLAKLKYVHDSHHLDICPDKIFVSSTGRAMLSTYGISFFPSNLNYRAPEFTNGGDLDLEKIDIWALGKLADIARGANVLDKTLDHIIQRCLEPNPKKRASIMEILLLCYSNENYQFLDEFKYLRENRQTRKEAGEVEMTYRLVVMNRWTEICKRMLECIKASGNGSRSTD